MKKRQAILLLFFFLLGTACKRMPIPSMDDFTISRYMGKWYEIARLDHSFEKNLEYVTADYLLLKNGRVKVVNRGYDTKKGEWKIAEAIAKSTHTPNFLKVYFFPLVPGSYNIAYVSPGYDLAVVSGGAKYLWFLSRTPQVTLRQKQRMLSVATALGYDTTKLIYPKQDSISVL